MRGPDGFVRAAGTEDPPAEAGKIRRLARLFARFDPLLRPYRKQMLFAGICTLGEIAMGLLAPWPIQVVIDAVLLQRKDRGLVAWVRPVLPEGRVELIAVCCVAVLVVAGLRGLLSYWENLTTASVGQNVISELREAVFNRLQHLSIAFHSQRRTGDLLVRLTGDVSMLREVLVPSVLEFASQSLLLVGVLGLMLMMDPTLTLFAVATLPFLAVATVRFGSRLRAVSREQRRKEARIATVAGEALASVALIQAYSREEDMTARFSRNSQDSLHAGLKALRLEESLSRIVEMTLAVGSCLVLGAGAMRTISGDLSPGELVVFLTYLRGVYRPVQAIVRIAGRASKAIACGERVLEILNSQEEIQEAADAVQAPPFRGEIVFDRVTFGYDPERPVLREISFRAAPGEKVGLVGPSGSGKSTIVALLLRLHEPQQGRILVDGHDIRSFTLKSYRRRIAVVLQEPFLFGLSVEDNIRQGRLEATPEEIGAAARAAGADGFIRALPDGYETILGERGTSLSRGQQQRIALARALVRGTPILVFDEPTTGLDARNEAEIVETLAHLGRGRTCLWIAHDLGQILGCERVLVIRDGRLVEDGDPSELLAGSGAFQALFGRDTGR